MGLGSVTKMVPLAMALSRESTPLYEVLPVRRKEADPALATPLIEWA
jgi:hypothetical protein